MSNINPYAPDTSYAATGSAVPAAFAEESERAGFIRRTYMHLAGAVFALVALETAIFALVPSETLGPLVMRMGGMGWLVVLAVFMAVSWLARSWATSDTSRGIQYLGLGLYVVAEALILLPLLYIAVYYVDPQLPMMAGIITVACFGGLTAFVMTTRVDLAPWGKYLAIAGFVAMGAIAASIITGAFSLGIVFSAAMIALACGYILYDTSNVLHHYRTDQYVAASLALFASVALLFWYVLRIMMMFASDDWSATDIEVMIADDGAKGQSPTTQIERRHPSDVRLYTLPKHQQSALLTPDTLQVLADIFRSGFISAARDGNFG